MYRETILGSLRPLDVAQGRLAGVTRSCLRLHRAGFFVVNRHGQVRERSMTWSRVLIRLYPLTKLSWSLGSHKDHECLPRFRG